MAHRLRRFVAPVAVAVVLAPLVFEALRTLTGRGAHVALWGDNPLLELATRDALHGHQLLGPYSRFGWHHPGPAYFYWLALPVLLMEPAGAGIFLGATLLNLASATALLAVVWRRAGGGVAAWTAAAMAAFFVALTPDFLRQPWNPFVVVLPLALLVVLCADGAIGHLPSLAWGLVVGSFAVQTHVSVAAAVGVLLGLGLVAWLVGWWRAGRGWPRAGWPWTVAGLAVFVLMWMPPLADAVRHNPSNVTLMWRFFTSPQPHHTLVDAAKASLTAATSLPFGNTPFAAQEHRSHAQLVVGGLALLVLGAAAILIGWRRRQPTAIAIALGSLVALAVGIVATTRVTDTPIYVYLVVWQAFVPFTLLVGLAWALCAGRRSSWVPAAGLIVTVAAAGVFAARDARLRSTSRLGDANVAAAAKSVEGQLGPNDRTVRITIVSHDTWPTAAGLALELERDGHHTTVANNGAIWTVLFGARRTSHGNENADVELYLTTDAGGAGQAQGKEAARIGDTVVLTRQLQPAG